DGRSSDGELLEVLRDPGLDLARYALRATPPGCAARAARAARGRAERADAGRGYAAGRESEPTTSAAAGDVVVDLSPGHELLEPSQRRRVVAAAEAADRHDSGPGRELERGGHL